MEQDIKEALEQFHTLPGSKRGLLLTATGVFLLCNSKFIPITSCHITLQTADAIIDSHTVPFPIFAGLCRDKDAERRFLAAQSAVIRHLIVIFHIALGAEDELLRIILFSQEPQMLFALFSYPVIERIFESIVKIPLPMYDPAPIPEKLLRLQEDNRRRDFRRLTTLYLNGKPWKELPNAVKKAKE